MRKNVVKLVAIGLMAMTVLVGCGSKEEGSIDSMSKGELRDLVKTQWETIDQQEARIQEVEEILKGHTTEEGPTAAISEMGDGTGRLTFNSLDGKIVFPQPFVYPGSSQAATSGRVNITNNISILPTGSWALKIIGTTVEMEHSSGISGTIKVGYVQDLVPMETFQADVFSPLFEGHPAGNIIYSKLFLGDQNWGMDARTDTRIDEEPGYLRVGMLALGDTSFTYTFVYKGAQDSVKDEAVLSLLRTIEMLGQPLSVE